MAEIGLTRLQWGSFLDTPQVVLETVNAAVGHLLRTVNRADECLERIKRLLGVFSNYGFNNTEPHSVAESLVRSRFGL